VSGAATDIAAAQQDTIDDLIATVQAQSDVIARLLQSQQQLTQRVAALEDRVTRDTT
jgi:uncharacterized coiled-coil protein SlyX